MMQVIHRFFANTDAVCVQLYICYELFSGMLTFYKARSLAGFL